MGRILCKILLFLTLTCGCVFGYNLNVESALTFKDPSVTKSRGSYFGFTVVLINNTETGSWLLVGAPRANSTYKNHRNIVEPGVLFKCHLKSVEQICEQFLLDAAGNGKNQYNTIPYYERKDGAWIGGAMDICRSGDVDEVITCGPRWVNQNKNANGELKFYMLGICYMINIKDIYEINKPSRGGTKTIMVPKITETTYKKPNGSYVYYYAYAEAGLSVHYALQPNKGQTMARNKKLSDTEAKLKKKEYDKKRREKMKSDPAKLEKLREKERAKYLKKKQKGQVKSFATLSSREKRLKRKNWKKNSQNYRNRKAKIGKNLTELVYQNNIQRQSMVAIQSRKQLRKRRAIQYAKIARLEKKLKEENKKKEKFRKRYQRQTKKVLSSLKLKLISKEDPMILTGVPGVLNWQGGLLYATQKCDPIEVQQNRRRRDVTECSIRTSSRQNITTVLDGDVDDFSLFGYQVNSGKFFSDKYSYVASAPRGSNMAGKVLLFSIAPKFEIRAITGTKTGEYFGASMAVADVNGDHLHDLIIGAPMFDKKFEEGRIYIYYGSNEQNMLIHGDPVNGYSERSRFGAAITSLGDIDLDGYEDIAVGAPYEGNGAVYIFSGSSEGLRKEYSQRIVAKNNWPNLKGFGISISKPSDIDNNHYNDIAVGSYLSGNAVVLRSHPVAKLCMSLTSKTKFTLLNASNFIVQLDLWFEGQYVNEIDVDFNVTLDKKYTHGKISTGSPHQAVITYKNIVTLKSGENHTEQLTVYLDKNKHKSSNQVSQTMIVMAASLYKNDSAKTVKEVDFTKLLPVLHKYDSKKSTSLSIPISPGCGKNICYCDLELTAYLKQLRDDDTFVTGSVKILDLEITVLNKVDTAYQTTVCIILPDPVQLDSLPKNCNKLQTGLLNTININCNVAYVLRQDMKDSFTVQLDVTRATHDFNISISVSSIIDDMDLSNNFKSKMIRLVTDADVTIAGKDESPHYDYNRDYPKAARIIHKYEVQKFKDSSVDEVEVTLNVPWFYYVEGQIEPISIVKSYEMETFQNDKYYDNTLKCDSIPKPEQGILHESYLEEDPGQSKHSVDESSVDISRKKSGLTAINSAVYLNCTNLSNNTMCRVIKCSTRPFTQKNIIVRITLTMEINLAHLDSYVGKNGEIIFSTDGSVKITKPAMQQFDGANELTDNATVKTAFNSYTQEKVETKIYIIAIIVGLLLVLLLLLGLIKVGFFKRKKREEMKKSLLAENAAEAPTG